MLMTLSTAERLRRNSSIQIISPTTGSCQASPCKARAKPPLQTVNLQPLQPSLALPQGSSRPSSCRPTLGPSGGVPKMRGVQVRHLGRSSSRGPGIRLATLPLSRRPSRYEPCRVLCKIVSAQHSVCQSKCVHEGRSACVEV